MVIRNYLCPKAHLHVM